MENNKKIIVPTIIVVVTLVLLVIGATYAYFTTGSTNNFGTKDLSATVEDMAGSVVLQQIENELSLDVTRIMMSQDNAGTWFYASGSSTPANIAKISVAGEGKYACDYTIKVTKSASSAENDLYTALRNAGNTNLGVAYLSINNTQEDLWWFSSSSQTYSGTIHGITKDTSKYITANLSLLNENSNQNHLKGKDITLTLEVTEFDCYLQEVDDSVPIYAIYSEISTDESSLLFYQNRDEVNVGDTYDGYTVTEIYRNLNNTNYTSFSDVPWGSILSSVDEWSFTISFEDVISPKSTAYWFANSSSCNYDLANLDTSRVTDMSHMFEYVNCSYNFNVDLSQFDTSNVTDMSYMFYSAGPFEFYADLSSWDTSNVTNMSNMFKFAGSDGRFSVNISTWDTSNVTNMESMFERVANFEWGGFSIGDITRKEVTANGKTYIAWDTSKVTNMSNMFSRAGEYFDYNLNLTSWQVPLVTNHTNFNKGVESKITPPIWVN